MSRESLEPLEPELARLFEAEARFPAESAALRTRVWEQVQTSTAWVPRGEDPGEPDSTPMDGSASDATTHLAIAGLGKFISVGLVAFIGGAATGALLYRASVPAPEPVTIEVPVSVPAMETPTAQTPVTARPTAAADTAPQTGVVVRGTVPRRARTERREAPHLTMSEVQLPDSDLASERAIIDVARTAIARNHGVSALTAIDRHAREFPEGQLAEEREGLRVIALVRADRADEAREKAAQFRSRYPRSLLLPAIESALP